MNTAAPSSGFGIARRGFLQATATATAGAWGYLPLAGEVAGDPFTDFDTLVRTGSVPRGGLPFVREELVGAFADAAGPRSTEAPGRTGTGSAT